MWKTSNCIFRKAIVDKLWQVVKYSVEIKCLTWKLKLTTYSREYGTHRHSLTFLRIVELFRAWNGAVWMISLKPSPEANLGERQIVVFIQVNDVDSRISHNWSGIWKQRYLQQMYWMALLKYGSLIASLYRKWARSGERVESSVQRPSRSVYYC